MLSRLRRDDAGMTLVELVVGMTLMSIVGAIAVGFFVGMSTQASRVTAQTLDASSARTAINQITTVLRLADSPTNRPGYSTARFLPPTGQTQLSATEIVFFSNLGSATTPSRVVPSPTASPSPSAVLVPRTPPAKIDIALSGGTLTESVYAPIRNDYTANADCDGNGSLDCYDYTRNYPAPTAPTSRSVLLVGVSNAAVFTYCSSATDVSTTCTAATTPDSVAVVQVLLTLPALRGNAAQSVQSSISITGAVS